MYVCYISMLLSMNNVTFIVLYLKADFYVYYFLYIGSNIKICLATNYNIDYR